MCHFELKTSSGKVMNSPPALPPRIELASCIQYICEKSEIAPTFFKKIFTSGIFPKILKTFSLFRTFFKKSFYGILRQTEYRYFSNIPCAIAPNSPKLPSTGVISKITINCALPFQLFSKKFYLFTTAIAETPRKGHNLSELFSKKSVTLYRGYFPNSHLLCCCFPKKSEKTSPLHH